MRSGSRRLAAQLGRLGRELRAIASLCALPRRSGRPRTCVATLAWRCPFADLGNPYRMAALQGRVVEIRFDEGCRYMDPISVKYTSAPFPRYRVCFVIAAEKAGQRTLGFVHDPG